MYGLNESDLGAVRWPAGAECASQDDPEPERNIFIRSDQYSFIRRGIPSLAMKVGYEKGSAEEKIAKNWLKERYHAPADDIKQPVNKQAAATFDRAVARLLERVANQDDRPPLEGFLVLQAVRRVGYVRALTVGLQTQ